MGVEKGRTVQKYQNALIENVFGHRGVEFFVKNQKADTCVDDF